MTQQPHPRIAPEIHHDRDSMVRLPELYVSRCSGLSLKPHGEVSLSIAFLSHLVGLK